MNFYQTAAFQQIQPVIQRGENKYPAKVASQRELLKKAALQQGLRWSFDAEKKLLQIFSASNEQIGFLKGGTQLSLNHKSVLAKLKNKYQLLQQWRQAGLPVANSALLRSEQDVDTIVQAGLTYPLVVKPLKGQGGIGITVGVTNKEQLQSAIRHAQATIPGPVVIESFAKGLDVRCYLLDGKLVAASSRLNAHVTGDGKQTINQLIARKNAARARHPHLKRFNIPALSDPEGSLLLSKGEYRQLSAVSNLHQGGESVDVTALMPSSVINIVQQAGALIPRARAIGIDILLESFDENAQVTLIEANSGANISVHAFPLYGKPIAIGQLIVQAMLKTHPSAESDVKNVTTAEKTATDNHAEAIAAKTLQQIKATGLYSSNICSYAITNEAIKRQLKVRWFTSTGITQHGLKLSANPVGNVFEIQQNDKALLFTKTRCLNYSKAADQYRDKAAFRKYTSGIIAMPAACQFFYPTEQSLLDSFVAEYGFPIVIKPAKGSMGKNVFVNIQNAQQLTQVLHQCRKQKLIVEQYIQGQEFRVYVLGDKVLSIALREPANVIADGKSSIERLLTHKNKLKKQNKLPLIPNNELLLAHLESQNLTLSSIVPAGQKIMLSDKLGRSSGGDIVGMPLSAYPQLVSQLSELGRHLTEVDFFGADLIIDSNGNTYLLEINCRPQISSALLPDSGVATNIPRLLIDHYFPESQPVVPDLPDYEHQMLMRALRNETVNAVVFNQGSFDAEAHTQSANKLPLYRGELASIVKYEAPRQFKGLGNINQVMLRRAAWLSGAQVDTFYNQQKKLRWSVTNAGLVLKFRENMPPQTSHKTRAITNDKLKTKEILHQSGIAVPLGLLIDTKKTQDAIQWFNQLTYRKAVVKPLDGSGGKGVTSAISNTEDLLAAIKRCNAHQVLVEPHIEGADHRLLVVGGRMVAAIKREPASVVGDGKSSIKQLVQLKNAIRKHNPYTGKTLLTLDKDVISRLERQGVTPETIPDAGKHIMLQSIANIGAGGDSYDVSTQVHPDFIQIAEQCWHAFADLAFCGIDLIAADITKPASTQNWAVIEINANCDVAMHHFPTFGASRDAAAAVMCYLFGQQNPEIITYELRIKGRVQQVGYRKWLSRQATLRGIVGSVENLPSGEVMAILNGPRRAVEDLISACAIGPANAIVDKVTYQAITTKVPAYFRINEHEK